MSSDLYELFQSLVLPLEQPSGRSLSAVAIPGSATHRLAKDSGGAPALLLRESASSAPAAPIRLQNLLISYRVTCAISHPDGQQEQGTFTILKCSGSDPALFPHFLRILSPIITSLGVSPTAAAIRREISGLVDLFQALTTPAKKSVQGLWAELLVIRLSTDPLSVAAAWHGTPVEHVDFFSGRQRLEVKSTSTRQRVHHFSLVQLTPPPTVQLLVASVFVDSVGGGLSLSRLVDEVREILVADNALLSRFDSVFYTTLGASWSDAMEECFDLELASESLQFFDSATIPKVEGPIPTAVGEVRFTSNLSAAIPVTSDMMRAAGGLFAAALPTGVSL